MSNPYGDPANPYQTPQGVPQMGGPPPSQKVQGPAIGLMVTGGIGLALSVLGLVLNVMGVGLGAMGGGAGGEEQMAFMAQGALGMVQAAIGAAVSAFAIYGGMQMKNLQNYGVAFAASILVMVPCISPCCLIGLPIGIWAVVTLNDPIVKASFR